jgi:hypothetical protein
MRIQFYDVIIFVCPELASAHPKLLHIRFCPVLIYLYLVICFDLWKVVKIGPIHKVWTSVCDFSTVLTIHYWCSV